MQESNQINITNDLVKELLKEKRSTRRWKNFRSLLWLVLFTYIAVHIFGDLKGTSSSIGESGGKYVALIRLDGMIAPDREFSAEQVVPTLLEAFKDKNSKGVVIDINSPGGTPVQASIIHDAILEFKKKYKKKVIVVGEDMLTSGAYFISVAADQIYLNPNTITGSIGVIMKGFGFVDAMKKIGIERRVYTAGNSKDRLDPFLPQNPEDLKKIQVVMATVHQNFVQAVIEGRKGKLQGNQEELFSGDFWSGTEAVKLGLADHLGNLNDAMKIEFDTTEFKEFGRMPNLFRVISSQLGSSYDRMVYTMH